MKITDMIVELRGGIPENCDFCGKPFSEIRQPIPEEAGEWTCSECLKRWMVEDAKQLKEKNT